MSYFSGRIPPLAKEVLTPLRTGATTMISQATRDSAARRQLAIANSRSTPRTFNQALIGFENVPSTKTQKEFLILQQLAEANCEFGKSTFTQALAGFENVTISRRGRLPKKTDNGLEQALRGSDRQSKVSMVALPKPKTVLESIAEEVTLLLAASRPVRPPKSNAPWDVKGMFLVYRD
ncbi:hypothetical protein BGX38DRAFT_1141673 [Terfezia claveryi]|nr:hypothetical protein BGX38DRAFT_1141673 [Terfezia claveryi]